MLKRYLGIYYLWYTTIALTICLIIFASADAVFRLQGLMSIAFLPMVMRAMLPMLLVLSVPLATTLAMTMLVAVLFQRHELLLFSYLKPLRRRMFIGWLSFTLVGGFFYVPLVLNWAPIAHSAAKSCVSSQRFATLLRYAPTGLFYTPFEGYQLYVGKAQGNRLHTVIIVNTTVWQLIAASAEIDNDGLTLYNVYLHSNLHGAKQFAHMASCRIPFCFMTKQYAAQRVQSERYDYIPACQLLQRWQRGDGRAGVHLHSRIGAIIWMIFMPLFGLWYMSSVLRFDMRNAIRACLISGSLFLLFYSTTTYITIVRAPLLAASVIYGTLMGTGIYTFRRYRGT